MKFHNKVVWITGASSGIGEALAYAFAAEGALLVLSARREEELHRVAKTCGNAYVLPFDMLSLVEHADRVQDVINTYGRIDYLVLNAGVSQRSLTQAVLPIFTAQKSGVFVPIASVAGRISTPRRAAYGATKHALIGFFDSVRAEVFVDGMRVTTILPGYIKTNISLHAMNEKGEAYGKMDPNQAKGLDPNFTAQKILQAILAEKNEFFVGGFLEGFGLFVKRFFPSIMPFMLRKIKNT